MDQASVHMVDFISGEHGLESKRESFFDSEATGGLNNLGTTFLLIPFDTSLSRYIIKGGVRNEN